MADKPSTKTSDESPNSVKDSLTDPRTGEVHDRSTLAGYQSTTDINMGAPGPGGPPAPGTAENKGAPLDVDEAREQGRVVGGTQTSVETQAAAGDKDAKKAVEAKSPAAPVAPTPGPAPSASKPSSGTTSSGTTTGSTP